MTRHAEPVIRLIRCPPRSSAPWQLTNSSSATFLTYIGQSAGRPTPTSRVIQAALAGSTYIVVARVGHRLIGLARLVSDSASIAYLQDVLVHPRHQRSGIGAALVTAVFTPYQAVRQKVLLADDQPTPRAFYLSIGWQDLCRHPTVGLRAFVRFDG